jgi:hypothetical protein
LPEFKYFSSETFESEELVVTPKMREEAGSVVGPWYICVYGRWASSYKLTVTNENRDHRWLTAGIAENGYVNTNETMAFYY